jgi:hypothetical protein
MGDGQAGDLDGELRRIKSEVRRESLNKSWERWLGVKNLAGTGNVAFTFVSTNVFTVNDDFVGINRAVAYWGRKVRAFGSGGFLGLGSIIGYSYVAPNTTITVQWDPGSSMDATLTEVQFGPHPGSASIPASNPLFPQATASVVVTGQMALTNLYTGTVFANSLLTNRSIRYTFLGKFSVNINSTITFSFTYGSSQMCGLFITGDTSFVWSNRPLWIEVMLVAYGSLTIQLAWLRAAMQGTSSIPGPRFGSPGAERIDVSYGTATENSQIDQPVALQVQMSASANDSVVIDRVIPELI